MLLAVDVGNTETHAGIFSRAGLDSWRTSTDPKRTPDELAAQFQQFLAFHDLSFSRQVTGVAICSVVPALTASLREMVQRYFHFKAMVVEPGIRTGMPILIENPAEVGADRICNAVAALAVRGGPAIVVDFGTATTFDVLSHRGEYLGGAIAPGVALSAEALTSHAARIPRVELFRPRNVIGRTTADSVRAGVVFGAAAMVEGMISRIQAELGGEAKLVATGGLATLVLRHSDLPFDHVPDLTLDGLRILYERNAQ
jgi:type III pantothenate kinase